MKLAPALALRRPLPVDGAELFAQHGDARADEAAVGFDLRLARPLGPDAALLAREVRPRARQAGADVVELREFDLRLGGALLARRAKMSRMRPLRSTSLTAWSPVESDPFEVAELDRRQVVVEDDEVGAVRSSTIAWISLTLPEPT